MTEYSLMYKTISSEDDLPVLESDIRDTLDDMVSLGTSDILDDLTESDWENCNKDMMMISDKFTNVLFNLMFYGDGESGIIYYFNGKDYEKYPIEVVGNM